MAYFKNNDSVIKEFKILYKKEPYIEAKLEIITLQANLQDLMKNPNF